MADRARPLWLLVLSASIMLAINMGIRQTFGLYLKPISTDLNLDRQVYSLAMALLNLIWGAGAPIAGALSDRFGGFRVILGGVLLYVAGLVMMATATSSSQLILGGSIIGLGISGSGFTAVFGVIARAAPPDKRSSALGVATMGSAIGQFVSLPYAHAILDATGWVNTLFILAATAAIMAPLAFAFTETKTSAQKAFNIPEQTLGNALKEALRYPSFLLLTAGFFVCGFQLMAIAIHLPSFLGDRGFDPGLGALALTIIGAGNILGTYACGRLGELMPKRIVLTLIYLGRGMVFLALLYLPLSATAVMVYAFIFGIFWLGTVPLTNGLIVTFFGPRWLSTLYGIVFFSHQLGSFAGAWLGGWFYDHYKSYDMLWWSAIAASLLAAVLHMPIREEPSSSMVSPVPA
jgi:predicted MFS family arabinose efflux permease